MNCSKTVPEALTTDGLLSPDEYPLLAGPPLKAASEVAASRGDPDLFNDMASMLALMAMVGALTRCYRARASTAAALREELDSIPVAVCALVFSRSGLSPDDVKDCLSALPEAYRMLREAGVLGPQDAYVEQAFAALEAGEPVAAHGLLLQAAVVMVEAVDRWEEQRARHLS